MLTIANVLAPFSSLAFLVAVGLAQTPDVTPTFDVISIKPNTSGALFVQLKPAPGGKFLATNVTTRMLLGVAFGSDQPLHDFQIVAGPKWLASERFDVRAQADDPSLTDHINVAVRAMLEDRFQLKAHFESRELPIYELKIMKGGPNLTRSEELPTDLAAEQSPRTQSDISKLQAIKPRAGAVFGGPGTIRASGISMPRLAYMLSNVLDRIVVDETALIGLFDTKLAFETNAPSTLEVQNGLPTTARRPEDSRPSLSFALEQLGLRLEPTKGAVDVLVIDYIQEPDAN